MPSCVETTISQSAIYRGGSDGPSYYHGIERAAQGVRPAPTARVDPAEIARQLGVGLLLKPMADVVWGLTLSADKVVVNERLPSVRRRFAIAHELGHVLVRRDIGRRVDQSGEERFADWFARELLMPRASLEGAMEVDADRLAAEWDVEPATVLLQLSSLRGAPQIRLHGGEVLCLRCGHRSHVANCACRPLRRKLKRTARLS